MQWDSASRNLASAGAAPRGGKAEQGEMREGGRFPADSLSQVKQNNEKCGREAGSLHRAFPRCCRSQDVPSITYSPPSREQG